MNELINKTSTCWLWLGRTDRDGYARFKGRLAHRLVYEDQVGPIPAVHDLDHLCRNRICVNPAHMEPVTHAENVARSEPATKTHCKHGHPFDEKNTYIRPDKAEGKRQCRICNCEASRRARIKAAT